MSNSKLFEKITLNNGVEIDNRLAVPPNLICIKSRWINYR